jgi:hypothetical protein
VAEFNDGNDTIFAWQLDVSRNPARVAGGPGRNVDDLARIGVPVAADAGTVRLFVESANEWVHLVDGAWVIANPAGGFVTMPDGEFRERFAPGAAG